MSFKISLVILAGSLGSGCASTSPVPIPTELERITYEAQPGPFCGRCETRAVTVAEDGRIWVETGYWTGDYRNWRTRHAMIQTAPEVFHRFRVALEPYRPAIERIPTTSGEFCDGPFIADVGEIVVTWSGPRGSVRRWFEQGCGGERETILAVRAAREALPVGD